METDLLLRLLYSEEKDTRNSPRNTTLIDSRLRRSLQQFTKYRDHRHRTIEYNIEYILISLEADARNRSTEPVQVSLNMYH